MHFSCYEATADAIILIMFCPEQKYRLHIRKLPASSAAQANGLWMVQDQCKDPSKPTISQSNSPQGPFHGCGSLKDVSSTGGDSIEAEDDDVSESHS